MSEETPPQPLSVSDGPSRESTPASSSPPGSAERAKPRLGLALKASGVVPPLGAPVAVGAPPRVGADLTPSVAEGSGEPAGLGSPAAALPPTISASASVGSPSSAAIPGGVVVPLFREGSDPRQTTLLFIILAAILVFGGGGAVIWLLTRSSPSSVTVPTPVSPPSTVEIPNDPSAADPTAGLAPTPSPAIHGPVHDLLALGPPPSAQPVESDLASPRTFRVIPEPGAHPDVIRFVEEARVSGVSVGNPPRALINGRLVRGGALVEPKLGIIFLGLDSNRRVLIFRSAAGDVVRLEY